jgi:hypothetical protein
VLQKYDIASQKRSGILSIISHELEIPERGHDAAPPISISCACLSVLAGNSESSQFLSCQLVQVNQKLLANESYDDAFACTCIILCLVLIFKLHTTFSVWCRAGLRGENLTSNTGIFTSHKRPKTAETRMHYTHCYAVGFFAFSYLKSMNKKIF